MAQKSKKVPIKKNIAVKTHKPATKSVKAKKTLPKKKVEKISKPKLLEKKKSVTKLIQPIVEPIAVPAVLIPRFNWANLPAAIPPHIKFLITSGLRECESASPWPFPFAKFLAGLPQEMCGLEFALLAIGLEHDVNAISEICQMPPERVSAVLESARSNIIDRFSSLCWEIDRKWRGQISGVTRSIEPLVEQHLIPKVDKNFQLVVGSILLKGMGAKNLVYRAQK